MRGHIFIIIMLACLFGSLMGSLITFSLFTPVRTSNETHVIEKIVYTNSTLPLQERIASIFEDYKDSIVYIKVVKYTKTFFGVVREEAAGSGFIISDDGFIVTNDHVVSDASNVTVSLSNGDEFQAEIRGADPLNDVAVIKISVPYKLKPVEIGDSDNVRPGQFVIAIGSPFRLQNTITFGIVSATNRTLTSEGGFRIEKVIQTDAAVNPGNSGGPLINMNGRVIGINTAILSTSGGSEGIGFAIPINTAKRIYTDIIKWGRVRRPWLGISGIDVTKIVTNFWNVGIDHGVLIVDFTENSPARDAGLKETISRPGKSDFVLGDIIVGINNDEVRNMSDLLTVLMKYSPGDIVNVKIYRDGKFLTIPVKLGERPEE
ncbi:MAG: trypsin-like peptidase domain-containing protein [Candidatus Aenigmarchaeota archaeon]|nr:trypsin-like peptidase domain-containing protein [Candidatus Aenigmarchaeota archaeon]